MAQTDRKLGNFKDEFVAVLSERDQLELQLDQTKELAAGHKSLYETIRKELTECLDLCGIQHSDLLTSIRHLQNELKHRVDTARQLDSDLTQAR